MIQELLSFTLYSPLNLSIALLWLSSAALDFGELLYIAQLKEYRLDKLRDFFSTKQGKRFWFNYTRMMRIILAVVALLWPVNDVPTIKYMLMALLIVDITYGIYVGFRHHFMRPVFTKKIAAIIAVALCLEFIILSVTRDWAMPFLLLIIRVFLLTMVVGGFAYPTRLVKKVLIQMAKKKIDANRDHLKIIGITGSYGKSTVKEFVAQLLSKKYKVLKTPKNINTEIGVANFILKSDLSDIEVFVVEMGAYTMGEIKLICDMVHPDVGVLTAINEQHLALFGDIRNTQKAKYELLRSLPKNGLAIVNNDNEYCREFLDEIDAQVLTYGAEEEYSPTLHITNIEVQKKEKSISGKVNIYGMEYGMQIPVTGRHNAWNFAAAGLVAGNLGMTFEEIRDQSKKLELPERTLQEYGYGSCTIIDDSYNANPDGFKAALEHLGGFPSSRSRIVITRGMAELGPRSTDLHEEIGGEIDFVADSLVIISEDHSDALQRGVVGKYRTDILLRYETDGLLKYVKSLKHTDSVILLESRIPQIVYNELLGTNESS